MLGLQPGFSSVLYTQRAPGCFQKLLFGSIKSDTSENRPRSSAEMKWFSLVLALTASAPSQAALRFGCGTVTIQRLDPLVEPGKTPSAHLHQIVGGNAFNATMSGDIGNQGTCTTCTFSEDFSNYWTAVMFFKHPTNGSYKRVPIIENDALPPGINGGMSLCPRWTPDVSIRQLTSS